MTKQDFIIEAKRLGIKMSALNVNLEEFEKDLSFFINEKIDVCSSIYGETVEKAKELWNGKEITIEFKTKKHHFITTYFHKGFTKSGKLLFKANLSQLWKVSKRLDLRNYNNRFYNNRLFCPKIIDIKQGEKLHRPIVWNHDEILRWVKDNYDYINKKYTFTNAQSYTTVAFKLQNKVCCGNVALKRVLKEVFK